MKQYSIFPKGVEFHVHTPDHEVISVSSFRQAVSLANMLRESANLWWWTEWFTYKPLGGRARWVRHAIVRPGRS